MTKVHTRSELTLKLRIMEIATFFGNACTIRLGLNAYDFPNPGARFRRVFAAVLFALLAAHTVRAQTSLPAGTHTFRSPPGAPWDAGWAFNPSWGDPNYIALFSLDKPASTTQEF